MLIFKLLLLLACLISKCFSFPPGRGCISVPSDCALVESSRPGLVTGHRDDPETREDMRRPWMGIRLGKEWITLLYWRINPTSQPFLSSGGHRNTRLPAASAARGAPKQHFSSQHLIAVWRPDTGSRIFLLNKGWLYFTLPQTSRSYTSASSQALGMEMCLQSGSQSIPGRCQGVQRWILKSRQHKFWVGYLP